MQIIELEKKLDAKQALELELERLRGAVQVMEHIRTGGDEEVDDKLVAIQVELEKREKELEDLEVRNQALIVKERKSNDELQESRKELINVRIALHFLNGSLVVFTTICYSYAFKCLLVPSVVLLMNIYGAT